MLELHIADADVTSGSISVGWCVSVETLKLLADKGIKNPVVVLCTAPAENYGDHREYRKVVPLKDLVGYIEFRSAGKNNIWGFIADAEKSASKLFLEKAGMGYHRSILNYDGTGWCSRICRLDSTPDDRFSEDDMKELVSEPVSVWVPSECFAAEPPQWEKDWVNHFLDRKVVDQCDFRRRRLFAYTVQPFIMFFNLLLRFMFLLVASLFALRGWSLKQLLHPLSYTLKDAAEVMEGGTWCVARTDNKWLKYIRLPLMPILLCAYVLLYKLNALPGAGIALLAIVTTALVIGGLSMLCIWLYERHEKLQKLEPAWFLSEHEMSYILCNTSGAKATSLKDLPFAKRTFRLRFQDFKTKVCRPFSA